MSQAPELMKNFPLRLILGSASPRRKELLAGMGFTFRVQRLDVDEDNWPEQLMGGDIARHLSEKKAKSYPAALSADEVLITADTIVWCEGKIYNKPENAESAKRMLKSLSGKMHEVYTAVSLRQKNSLQTFCDLSKVWFKDFTEAEIDYYISEYRPFDKAGSYGVQEWLGYIGIEKIEGSFYNVMGLPVKKVYEELTRIAKNVSKE
jgi:septum formation protein